MLAIDLCVALCVYKNDQAHGCLGMCVCVIYVLWNNNKKAYTNMKFVWDRVVCLSGDMGGFLKR